MLTPRKIKLAGEGGTLRIEWSDGHVSAYPYRELREKCPCATCTGSDYEPHHALRSNLASGPFPMFQKALKPERAEVVGRYALQIYWSDGHSTGIYAFDYLRSLCPCAECKKSVGSREQGVG